MSWRRGPDEKRNQAALNRHQDKNEKALRAGDPKATRISERLNDRTNEASREGR